MDANEHEDRLIDVLLAEQMGGRGCPDLSMRILVRAYSFKARVVRYAFYAGSAAAVLVVGMLAYVLLSARYPAPALSGQYSLSQDTFRRGATISTARDQSADVVLGGYCNVQVAAQSRVDWRGDPKAEELFLHEGSVTCKVDRGVGRFSVVSEFGKVSVKGTEFSVTIVEPKGDETMIGKRMLVKVLAGAVIASTAWTSMALAEGDQATLPQGGTVTGVVTEKGDAWIRVKTEDGKSERYTPVWVEGGFDKEMVATIGKTAVGSKVKVVWKQDERPRVLSLTVLEAPKEGAGVKESPVAVDPGKIAAQEAKVAELRKAVGAAEEQLVKARKAREAGEGNAADVEAAEKNLKEARARLKAAQGELELMRKGASAKEGQPAGEPAARERIAKLEARVAELKNAAAEAEEKLAKLRKAREAGEATPADVEAAEKNLQDMRAKLQAAQVELERARAGANGGNQSVAQSEEAVAAAKAQLDKAQAQLAELQAPGKQPTDDQMAEAKARVERAQAKLKAAQDQLEKARAAHPVKD